MPKAAPHLKLRQIRIYIELAHRLHFGKVGRALGISTPTVTQAIKDLEEDLGVHLVDRDLPNVTLTDAGRLFLTLGGKLLKDEIDIRSALGGFDKNPELLRLAYQPSLAHLAVESLNEILEDRPALHVEFIEAVSREIPRKLQRHEAELGIGILPPEPLDGLVKERVTTTRLSFVGYKVHPLSRLDVVPLAKLVDEPFALPWLKKETSPGALRVRGMIEQYFAAHGFAARRTIFQGSTIASVLDFVRLERAVTVLAILDFADHRDEDHADKIAVLPLTPEAPAQETGFLWREDQPLSSAASDFKEAMTRRIKKLTEPDASSEARPAKAGRKRAGTRK
jgi:DNA-binding transcriptional LysR family regulator